MDQWHIDGSAWFYFHEGCVASDRESALVVNIDVLPALLCSQRNIDETVGLFIDSFHGVVLLLHIVLQLVNLAELPEAEAGFEDDLALVQEKIKYLFVKYLLDILSPGSLVENALATGRSFHFDQCGLVQLFIYFSIQTNIYHHGRISTQSPSPVMLIEAWMGFWLGSTS